MNDHLYATIRDLGNALRKERARADAAEDREQSAMQALAEARAELVRRTGAA